MGHTSGEINYVGPGINTDIPGGNASACPGHFAPIFEDALIISRIIDTSVVEAGILLLKLADAGYEIRPKVDNL